MITIVDLAPHVSRPDEPVRTILQRIDASPQLFQIIVDEAGRVVGTITDGDIRRAMLHGIDLQAPARACMNTAPKLGHLGDHSGNAEKLATLGSRVPFLPIVDEAGVLRQILYGRKQDQGIATALVMAGGLGSRLGERTRSTPKPLLPVGGRPILDHVLEGLENAGIDRIYVSVFHLAAQIEDFLKARPSRAKVVPVLESRRLGTAGALGLIDAAALERPLLVINGDVITRVDFHALHDFHERNGYDATIAVARHELEIPFGVVRYGEDGLFERVDEKPRVTHFVAAGVYYLGAGFMPLVPKDRAIDMPELLNLGRSLEMKIGLFPIHEYWTDVGRPTDLEAAERDHQKGGHGRG